MLTVILMEDLLKLHYLLLTAQSPSFVQVAGSTHMFVHTIMVVLQAVRSVNASYLHLL